VGWRGRRDPDPAPRSAAPAGSLPAQPASRGDAAFSRTRGQAPGPLAHRRHQPRRHAASVARDFSRRFVCLTFDDGYRDNLEHAYPILRDAGFPFAVYVPTSFPDRLGELWWLALEAVIARRERIGLVIAGENRTFDCNTVAEKRALYDELYWWLRGFKSEAELRAVVRDLAARYQVDIAAFCRDLCMSWQEIALLARDALVTIGAHTVNHLMLAKLPEKTVRTEMDLSRTVIEAALGSRLPCICRTPTAIRARRVRANLPLPPISVFRPQ
jgi:peptidoglycan/xylan/chitin deacetylase (PgdA/CDA1 family)